MAAAAGAPSDAAISSGPLPNARGHIDWFPPIRRSFGRGSCRLRWPSDRFVFPGGILAEEGWMLRPDGEFDTIAVRVKGQEFRDNRAPRPTRLTGRIPHVANAARAGWPARGR